MLRRFSAVGAVRAFVSHRSLRVLLSEPDVGRLSVQPLGALSAQQRAVAFQSTVPLLLKRTRTRKGRPSGILLSAMLGISTLRKEAADPVSQHGRGAARALSHSQRAQKQQQQRKRKDPAARRDALSSKLSSRRTKQRSSKGDAAAAVAQRSASAATTMRAKHRRDLHADSTGGQHCRRSSPRGTDGNDGNHDGDDDSPASSLEMSYANAAQILGILRAAYDAPHPSEERSRLFRGNHASLPKPLRGDADDEEDAEDGDGATDAQQKALRIRRLVRVEVPPVEVPVNGSLTTAFVPRELLRRVLREESGSSIAARAVTLNCLIKRAPATAAKLAATHESLAKEKAQRILSSRRNSRGPLAASAAALQAQPSVVQSNFTSSCRPNNGDRLNSETENLRDHRGEHHHSHVRHASTSTSTSPVTAKELDDAALVGDAALVAQERHVADSAQLRLAIADERPNTKLQDQADDPETSSGGVLIQPPHAVAVSDVPPQVVSMTPDAKNPSRRSSGLALAQETPKIVGDAQTDRAQEPAEASEARTGAGHEEATAGGDGDNCCTEGDGDEEHDDDDANAASEASRPRQLSGEDLQMLTPFTNGTVIPLSTNYVTRSERVDEPFQPFSPRLDAKNIPLLSTSALPPVEGVASCGTIVAVKVSHNRRDTLELAADLYETAQDIHHAGRKTKKNAAFARGAAAVAAKQIVLDRHVPNQEPHIEVFILNDDESFDFGNILFEVPS